MMTLCDFFGLASLDNLEVRDSPCRYTARSGAFVLFTGRWRLDEGVLFTYTCPNIILVATEKSLLRGRGLRGEEGVRKRRRVECSRRYY